VYAGATFAVLAGLAGVAAIGYYGRRPPAPQLSPAPVSLVVAPPSGAPAAALESLRASLAVKDYRTAALRGHEILRVDPSNDEARRGVDQAEEALREIETAVSRVREALDAGDAERASRALQALTALDPKGGETKTLVTRFTDAARVRAQESRSSMDAARRDAERRGVGPAEVASAGAALAEGDRALATGDFVAAARSFAQARDAFQRAQKAAPTPTLAAVRPPVAAPPVTVVQNPPQSLPAPPVTAPSPAAPQLSEAATKQAIRGVLDEYRQSFENRNADALRTVQPGIDYDQVKQTFAAVTAFGVRLEVGDVTVNGTSATARCLVTYSPVPKPAGKTKPVPTVFHLKKTGDLWLIERLERVEK
jgi:tetratricopeptide (TPR) repeat protein